MEVVILTGMSGAGKSTALKMMEDLGYYCIDNLPIPLISKFDEASGKFATEVNHVAFGIDVRNGAYIEGLVNAIASLKERNVSVKVLFLDADEDTLIRRYKETRRLHPLAGNKRVEDGIKEEREKLEGIRAIADYIIDTSHILTRDLKLELEKIFVQNQRFANLFINIISFGFKYGIPNDSDMVFDVRFLPNPYYVDKLRYLSGNDKEVQDYVMESPEAGIFLDKLEDMLEFLIPNYVKEGKTQLVISIGCTGGRHRSVTLANALYERLKEKTSYGLRVEHQDLRRDITG